MKKGICALLAALLLCVFCAGMAARAESVDLPGADPDGSAVTGEALFGDNEITLVHLWRVWCAECVEKMEALFADASVPKAGAAYSVLVKDEDGDPVEEVAIQFCDDSTCRLGETDADGRAVFEVSKAGAYEVHVLEAPEGYAWDEDEAYRVDETTPDVAIVLKKDE